MQYILLSIHRLALRRERSAQSFGPDQLNSGATDFNNFGPTLSKTMKYTSYILALQLCVILGSSICYSQSPIFNETEKLKRYFNATSSDVGNGGRLFLDILTNWKGESDIKIIQSQIVSFYFKLFENLEDNNTIQNSLNIIKEELRVKVFNSSNSKMEDFKKLIQIPVNDLRVQRKAISELFNVISELTKSNPKMRKRRQNLFRGWRA